MQCKQCGNKTRLPNHKFCSQRCYWKSLEGIKGENAPNWRKIIGKSQAHKWLDVNFGKPKICEGNNCRKNSTWYDWALKRDKRYERKRENFLRLCRSCHRRLDWSKEKTKQAIRNLWWIKGISNPGKPNFLKGYYYGK